jgi:hypothetical protein
MHTKAVISADGMTRTLTQTGKNAQRPDIHNVTVSDRQ